MSTPRLPQDLPPLSSVNSLPGTLVYSKSSRQILLLEAGKDLVDLILGFLSLPLGCIIRLLADADSQAAPATNAQQASNQGRPLPAMLNLYESVKKLDDSKMSSTGKAPLLEARPPNPWGARLGFLPGDSMSARGAGLAASFFCCTGSSGPCEYIASAPEQKCPKHNKKMETLCKIVGEDAAGGTQMAQLAKSKSNVTGPGDGKGKGATPAQVIQTEAAFPSPETGFVKPETVYMITNSLEIFPSSSVQSMVKLGALRSERLGDLETIEISVGREEVLHLLKASLNSSSSILNDVFVKFSKTASVPI